MMIRFCGRSAETHRIKNKPIGEGYNFFVLTTYDGFVVNFTPDGRSASKTNRQEYESDKGLGKIESMIQFVSKVLNRFRQTQQDRIKKFKERNWTRGKFDETKCTDYTHPMKKFCLALDNYFTLPKVILALREQGVGIVGTARARRNWPPKKIGKISQDNASFNDFFYEVDKHGTLVAKWMDNGLVLCVSTLHRAGHNVNRARKRPRVTVKNKNHVSKIWGTESIKKIWIPKLIDDYNHWMGGVDLVDQRIAYYHPDLRCVRNWLPMFMQILSIIRNNSYIVHRHLMGSKSRSHKMFTYEVIDFLMHQAHDSDAEIDQSRSSSSPESQEDREDSRTRQVSRSRNSIMQHNAQVNKNRLYIPLITGKRKRISCKHSTRDLQAKFPFRTHRPLVDHVRTSVGKRGGCVVCTMLYYENLKRGEHVEWDREVKRTSSVCSYCSGNGDAYEPCFLCKDHFRTWHERT